MDTIESKFAFVLCLVSLMFLFGLVLKVNKVSAWTLTDPRAVEDYVLYMAHREGVPAQLAWGIAKCESNFSPTAHNTSDPNGGSRGVFQFQEKTFYGFAQQYGIENPDIWNTAQQVHVAIMMLKNNLAFHWTCSKMV